MTNCIPSTCGRHLHLASSFWHAKMFILVFIVCTICLVRKGKTNIKEIRLVDSWRASEIYLLASCWKVDNLHQFSLNVKSIFTNVLPSKTHYFQSFQLFFDKYPYFSLRKLFFCLNHCVTLKWWIISVFIFCRLIFYIPGNSTQQTFIIRLLVENFFNRRKNKSFCWI